MQKAQIFISYRRDDTAGYARAIYDELAQHFTAERVFIDVDDIDPGLAFDEVIQRAVGTSEVLLVMIGTRWLGEREGLPARIEDADDFVRLEVAAGLAKGMRVIPLLLDGAAMPAEAQLPELLRPLARRNALEIGNTRFRADVDRLVAALRDALGEPAAPPPRSRKALWWSLAGVLLVVGGLAVQWQAREPARGDGAPSAARTASSTVAAPLNAVRPEINGEWQAEVTYDWPNARYAETFVFGGEAGELHGSASFLRVPRGILEGSIGPDGPRFVTRTSEMAGGAGSTSETVHRYRGTFVSSEIRFVLQTEGGSSPHVPVEFTARRVARPSSSPTR